MFKHAKNKYESGTLVFDCYIGQAGLPMEPGYKEITLTATDDFKKLKMDVYSRPTGDDEEESHTAYLVPSKALEAAMSLVREHKMKKWNNRQYPCMCGINYACKFFDDDKFIRVSSDNMPEDKSDAFNEIYFTLAGYIDPALKIGNSEK